MMLRKMNEKNSNLANLLAGNENKQIVDIICKINEKGFWIDLQEFLPIISGLLVSASVETVLFDYNYLIMAVAITLAMVPYSKDKAPLSYSFAVRNHSLITTHIH
jgi:hypothetical protein